MNSKNTNNHRGGRQFESAVQAENIKIPKFEEPSHVQIFSSIPESTRPTLERCIEISNAPVPSDSERQARTIDVMHNIDHCQKLMRTYCADDFSEYAYLAAALGRAKDIESGLGERRRDSIRAANEMRSFFANNSDDFYSDQNIYIAGLLQDRERLDRFKKMVRIDGDWDEYNPQPSRDSWLNNPELVEPQVLYDAVNDLNMESILISGVETLHALTEHGANDMATLNMVRYSEQIIAPIAEVMGLDALAMSLNSRTKIIRLRNGGRQDLIYMAESVIDRFADINSRHSIADNVRGVFSNTIRDALGDKEGGKFEPQMPVDYNSDNGSVYGDTTPETINIGGVDTTVAWRYRLKTVGSLAWKMHKAELKGADPRVTPMDILGLTAVVDSVEDQKRLFGAIVNGVFGGGRTAPYPAPSKTSPVHIRGEAKFIKNIAEALPFNIDIDEHVAPSPESLHLCKVTGFHAGNLPFEIQCVTRKFRDSMQTGNLAHILYKNNTDHITSDNNPSRWEGLLADIRSRRELLHYPGLVGANKQPDAESVRRAKEYLKRINESKSVIGRTIGYMATNTADQG